MIQASCDSSSACHPSSCNVYLPHHVKAHFPHKSMSRDIHSDCLVYNMLRGSFVFFTQDNLVRRVFMGWYNGQYPWEWIWEEVLGRNGFRKVFSLMYARWLFMAFLTTGYTMLCVS